jgi:hypothetical protein
MDETAAQEPGGARTTPLVVAYAEALEAGDAGLAADLFAENGLLTSADERISGRAGIAGWHEDLLGRGRAAAAPAGQGNDAARLEVDSAAGRFVVELSFDASGRIGTARWLTPSEAGRPQEERERTAT